MSLKLINCTKKFKNNLILDDVTFEIPKGIFQLKGRNGAGKSTFLKIISGLDKKYSGEIISNGASILYLNVDPIGIHPFTIRENLNILWETFNIKPTKDQINKIEFFFDGKLDMSYSRSSTGMKAKIGLSLIFVKNWDFILIDEAMSTLDSESIEVLSKTLVNLSEKNKTTIIYVSHSLINERLKDYSNGIYIGGGKIWCQNERN
nr:ATP-binding cassette domain-containing protein [Priestia flexa]WEZ10399.1 ATP-binding cassette domain-containing protein [Priestia flexa]WEZ10409.1 ATP-binding cassette domain-containing protein [Priestia flexa]